MRRDRPKPSGPAIFVPRGCNAFVIFPYKSQRLREGLSCSIGSFGVGSNESDSMENKMKRLILTLAAGTLLATTLGGCIVAPAPGYYGGGYYHHGGYYYR
jgi:hypothetical protein